MFKDRAPKPKACTVGRARKLRREMSLPEILLWRVLRGTPGGFKFRKQHPSGAFTLDLYCIDARLAVEVDSEAHNRGDRPERDERRDAWFARHGIATLRVRAADVLRDLDAVLTHVLETARSRLPLHHPAAPVGSPSPRQARGGMKGR